MSKSRDELYHLKNKIKKRKRKFKKDKSNKFTDNENYKHIGKKAQHSLFCLGAGKHKIQYATEKKAQRAIEYHNGDVIRAYYCFYCNAWHTTSQPKKDS